MNAAHRQNKRDNRLRRIARRLSELQSDKAREIECAAKNKRDPNLGDILRDINRLTQRAHELGA